MAEYERTLIAERMRRGRLAKLRAGQLLPWMRVPFGYRTDPERARDPAGLWVEDYEAAIVGQMFAWYLEQGARPWAASPGGSRRRACSPPPARTPGPGAPYGASSRTPPTSGTPRAIAPNWFRRRPEDRR